MQTLTQFHKLIVPPGKNTVEFKLIFTKEDYDKARDLCLAKGYKLWNKLSAETPVADRLEDLYLMMQELELATGAKEHEWKQGFFAEQKNETGWREPPELQVFGELKVGVDPASASGDMASITIMYPNDTTLQATGDPHIIQQLINRLDGQKVTYKERQ